MREVNNNTANPSNVNFQGVSARNLKEDVVLPDTLSAEKSEITDLGKMPAEVIGRSQVAKTAHQKDVDFALTHEKDVEDLNRYFDYLIDKRGLSYEQACAIIAGTAEEFYGA